MRLNYVEIKNFRSIEYAKIDFNPRCRILIGMNDTGKSNVLKALASYNNQHPIKNDDIRLERNSIVAPESCYVKYVFSLDNDDHDDLTKSLSGKIYGQDEYFFNHLVEKIIAYFDKGVSVIVRNDNNTFSPRRVFSLEPENWKTFLASSEGAFITKEDTWKKINKDNISLGEDVEFDIKNMAESLSKFSFVHKNNTREIHDILQPALADASCDDMARIISSIIKLLIINKFEIIFWESNNSQYQIPEAIPMSKFMKNPNDFLFIRNMLELYEKNVLNEQKFDNDFIIRKINEYQSNHSAQKNFKNYLEKVANEFTKNFSEIWKNYVYNEETMMNPSDDSNLSLDDIVGFKFGLFFSKGSLYFTINEKNDSYNISDRSEGLRKFITFLLIVSTKNICKNMSNHLFIIDEPETSLHHSAARDFRKELIKMTEGTNNYVVYGTHSISMIDKSNSNRHYVVKREQEVTKVINAEIAAKKLYQDIKRGKNKRRKYRNILEHEILYDRLGYSIYEALKEKNIMFEGWADKKLFEKYLEAVNIRSEELDFGVAHAWGVKSFMYISPIIELAERDLWIISDADEAAKNEKGEYIKNRGYGDWLTYHDVDSTIDAITGEDFVKNSFILKCVESYIEQNQDSLKIDQPLTEEYLQDFSHGNSKGARIQNYFYSILLKSDQQLKNDKTQIKEKQKEAKKIKNNIKDKIFTNLTANDIIIEEYKKLYDGIHEKIKTKK